MYKIVIDDDPDQRVSMRVILLVLKLKNFAK